MCAFGFILSRTIKTRLILNRRPIIPIVYVGLLKNTNESAKVVPSSTCIVAPTYGYNLLDRSQLPYLTTLAPALSYLPFTAAGPPTGAPPTHLAMTLPGVAAPLITDYNAAAAAAGGAGVATNGGVDPAYSYSSTSSYTVAAPPCLPMFFSSETSFQLSTSPCPSDASLTSQVRISCQSVDVDINVNLFYMISQK